MLDTSPPFTPQLVACGQPEVILDLAVLMSLPGVSQRRDAPVLKRLLGIFVGEMSRSGSASRKRPSTTATGSRSGGWPTA